MIPQVSVLLTYFKSYFSFFLWNLNKYSQIYFSLSYFYSRETPGSMCKSDKNGKRKNGPGSRIHKKEPTMIHTGNIIKVNTNQN